jgi:hypothetical protein
LALSGRALVPDLQFQKQFTPRRKMSRYTSPALSRADGHF